MSGNPASDLARLRHDLRTPLNHILGYAGLLSEEISDQGVSNLADLERISSAARALLDLIDTRLEAPAPGTARTRTAAPTGMDGEALLPSREAKIAGRILIVDDDPANRDVLSRHLVRQGHSISEAENGNQALELLAGASFDLVLLDVLMPGRDGFSVLREIKSRPDIRHIPVIMISALDDLSGVVRCIEAGAEDFLAKPFDPTLLRARIGACLEKMRLRDAEQGHLRVIEQTQARLSAELAEAARYVRSILPPPVRTPFPIDWSYVPSAELGGDSFGYHWIDREHFAIYLLDVCGHGVGAALLSVAAIQVIRTGALHGADFRDPSTVLAGLNATFRMERQNNMYFTIWYGVYHAPTRTLRHASGGHPPALLARPGAADLEEVRSPGPIIGVLPKADFLTADCLIPEGARLFAFSDGAYEIRLAGGGMMELDEFKSFLAAEAGNPAIFEALLTWIHGQREGGPLDDDFSILRLEFP